MFIRGRGIKRAKRPRKSAELKGGLLSMRIDNAPQATVRVAGQAVGEAPVDRATVPLGKQVVTVQHPGKRTWSQAIEFSDDELVEADLTLAGPRWPIWVSAGFSLVGVVLGTVGAVKAKSETEAVENQGCKTDTTDNCPYGFHHLSTASFITAGVSAAAGLTYYLLWGRHKEEIHRTKLGNTLPKTAAASASR